eukprot:2751305-Pyramimonas_sp.AAC.1
MGAPASAQSTLLSPPVRCSRPLPPTGPRRTPRRGSLAAPGPGPARPPPQPAAKHEARTIQNLSELQYRTRR